VEKGGQSPLHGIGIEGNRVKEGSSASISKAGGGGPVPLPYVDFVGNGGGGGSSFLVVPL